jgi:XTP/dITP diphosphohydrolase
VNEAAGLSIPEPITVVIATRNQGKVREFRSLFEPLRWHLLGLTDAGIDIALEETGTTFRDNAAQKAIACSRATSLTVLADDSGLEVFGLGGRPGVYSARYAGEGATDADRNRKLLAELERTGADRTARFVCALALARLGEVVAEAEGECRGRIGTEPRGKNGFGYDPIFWFPNLGRTYAELTEVEKNRWSHRARAVAALATKLGDWQRPGT